MPPVVGASPAMRLMAAKRTATDFYGQIRTALAAKLSASVCVAAGAAVVGVSPAMRLMAARQIRTAFAAMLWFVCTAEFYFTTGRASWVLASSIPPKFSRFL